MRYLFLLSLLVGCGSGYTSHLPRSCDLELTNAGDSYLADIEPCKAFLENSTGAFRFSFVATSSKPSLGRLTSVKVADIALSFTTEHILSNSTISLDMDYPNIERDEKSIQLPFVDPDNAVAVFFLDDIEKEFYPLNVRIKFELLGK